MLQILLTFIILQQTHFTLAQTVGSEELIQSDTVRIASGFSGMIFKYYLSPGNYGRFEIHNLKENRLVQSDTLESISMASYEDANFDGILDVKIVLELGANSGNDRTDYYVFNKTSKIFERKIVGLSQPSINPSDSTITESSGCCMETESESKTYKYFNGKLKVIRESAYDRNSSYTKQMVSGSLIITDLDKSTMVGEQNGQSIIVDSSWRYLYGKLRVIQVQRKRPLDDDAPDSIKNAEVVETDVMGAFIYDVSEHYEYVKDKTGKIKCNYISEKNHNNKWVILKDTSWFISN